MGISWCCLNASVIEKGESKREKDTSYEIWEVIVSPVKFEFLKNATKNVIIGSEILPQVESLMG